MSDYLDELIDGLRSAALAKKPDDSSPHGERPCPICGAMMGAEEEFGVTIDVCRRHGIWLDVGELPTIIDRIRAGARLAGAQAIREARTQGKLGGMFLGALSFLVNPFEH